jgi:hypothetical protein
MADRLAHHMYRRTTLQRVRDMSMAQEVAGDRGRKFRSFRRRFNDAVHVDSGERAAAF